jgi:hypothetical protein
LIKANRIIRIPWHSVRIGVATLASILTLASAAHAHGGMAGPSELGPPLLTSGALGLACYWLVMLWPSGKNRRRTPDGPGPKNGSRARSNVQSNGRKSARAKQTPHLKMVDSTLHVEAGPRSRGDVIDA